MDGRTIPLHGGGELTVGGGPLIDGLIHGWVRKPEDRGGNFMIGTSEARELGELLRARQLGRVRLFAGSLIVCHGGELAILWFYSWGQTTPDFVARLYDGAIDTVADALEEVCEGAEPARPHLRRVA